MKLPELVIFDCDGVLVDSEPVGNAVVADSLASYGFAIEPEEVATLAPGGTIVQVAKAATLKGAVLPASWVDDIYAEMFARLSREITAIDGVHDLLDVLDKAGIRKAIASNGPMRKMEITLGATGLWQRFKGAIYSGHDFTPKPSPAMLLQALSEARVEADRAIMVDDMPVGATAAKDAGTGFIGFAETGDPARFSGQTTVIRMSEIPPLLGLA